MKWYYISKNTPKKRIEMQNIQEIGDPKDSLVSCRLIEKGWGLAHISPIGEIDWRIAPIYEDANSFSEELWPYALDGKWGFLDAKGQSVLLPQWDYVFAFSQGFAVAYQGARRGLINKQGRWVIAPKADDLRSYSDGIAVGRLASTWFFIDLQGQTTGTSHAVFIQPFHENLAAFNTGGELVRKQFVMDGEWGFMNKKGETIISPQFSWVGNFSHHYAPYYDKNKEEWGLVSTSGARKIISGVSGIRSCRDDEIMIEVDGYWGIMTIDGKIIIPPEYDEIKFFSDYGYFVSRET